jgi:hypothetical protein
MAKATKSPTTIRPSLQHAHRALIAHLANARPPRIRGAADIADVENVVDHLQDVFRAVVSYVDAVVADTTDRLPVNRTDRNKVETLLWDLANEDSDDDLVRWLSQAGCRFDLPALAA